MNESIIDTINSVELEKSAESLAGVFYDLAKSDINFVVTLAEGLQTEEPTRTIYQQAGKKLIIAQVSLPDHITLLLNRA